jgi:hypothetical protein
LSSYLAEDFGDRESSLGSKLFYYQTATLIRPFSPRLHSKIATIYDQTGRFGDADHELSRFPQTTQTKLQLAQVRIHERHFPEAGNTLSSLNQKNPNVILLSAWAKFGEGNISGARADYAKLENGGVGDAFSEDNAVLGVLLALPDAEKASHLLRPSDPESNNLKPWVDLVDSYLSPSSKGLQTAEFYYSLALTRPALFTVNSVILTNPDYVPAIELKFSLNQALGQTGEMQKDLKILKKLNPTHKY